MDYKISGEKQGFMNHLIGLLMICFCIGGAQAIAETYQERSFDAEPYIEISSDETTSKGAIKKVAFVVGISKYEQVSPLVNPYNDAINMKSMLESFGFTVILGIDSTMRELEALRREFESELSDADVGLFFFAGHGVQDRDINYLIPIRSGIRSTADLAGNTLNANDILSTMERSQVATSIVILDACRNNPLASSSRGIGVGLAKMESHTGSLILYATAPGQTASDGSGSNGLFTGHLLANMQVPGANIYDVAMATRRSVMEDSNGKQVPWELSSLVQPFYFLPTGNQSEIMFSNSNQNTYVSSGKVPLTIYTDPKDANIELLNSTQEFSQGVQLLPKIYQIKITAEGYEPMVRSIDLTKANAFEFFLSPSLKDEVFLVDGVSFNMKAIAGAEFDMGCGKSKRCPELSIKDRKKVYLNGFRLMDTEVTNSLYALCVQDGSCVLESDDVELVADNRPMGSVSYYDVVDDFIPWLEYKTGQRFRLPTESEWEYVAKAKRKSNNCKYAHTAQCNPLDSKTKKRKMSALPVGSLVPNALGIFDLSGNMEEMVADCFTSRLSEIPADGAAFIRTSCQSHVIRGSHYQSERFEMHIDRRSSIEKNAKKSYLGFRLAQSPQQFTAK